MKMRIIHNNIEIELIVERCTDEEYKQDGYDTFIAHNSDTEIFIIILAISGIVKHVNVYGGTITIFEDDDATTTIVLLQRAQDAVTELIESEDAGLEGVEEDDDVAENTFIKPYNPDKIKVRQDKFSVEFVVTKWIPRGLLDLNPDFQRKFVWDRKRQSRLIESIMLGIPIPFMYLSESKAGRFNVVDGLQRLSTLRDYLNNKFPLQDLQHLTGYEGCYFDEKAGKKRLVLDPTMMTRVESFQLYFNIIEKSSPDEVKYDIFERLNTGGMPLNAQEIRNCNAEQNVRQFLKEAAASPIFRLATDYSVKGKRMDDQELVLRFAGFYLRRNNELEYFGNMKHFLNSANEYLNRSPEKVLAEIHLKFLNAMQVCHYMFGRYAFRKCLPKHLADGARKQFINKSMFVVWSVLTAEVDFGHLMKNYHESYFAEILAEKMVFRETTAEGYFITTNSDYNKLFTTGTFDVKNINKAFDATEGILKEFNLLPA